MRSADYSVVSSFTAQNNLTVSAATFPFISQSDITDWLCDVRLCHNLFLGDPVDMLFSSHKPCGQSEGIMTIPETQTHTHTLTLNLRAAAVHLQMVQCFAELNTNTP